MQWSCPLIIFSVRNHMLNLTAGQVLFQVNFSDKRGDHNTLMLRREMQQNRNSFIRPLLIFSSDINRHIFPSVQPVPWKAALHSFRTLRQQPEMDIGRIRGQISELLVLLSRTAAGNGMDEQQVLLLHRQWQKSLSALSSFQAVSAWLLTVVEDMLENLAAWPDVRHANIIHRCIQHIGAGYQERLTLEDTARMVCLSPDYLSRIFRQETGISFHQYLNNVRITKAKELIRTTALRLTDISQMVGYDDQSYFTKVFKRTAGIAPGEYVKKYRGASSVRTPSSGQAAGRT